MTKRKVCVGIIFGGCSYEHNVSLISASHVISHLDREKYEVVPIGITLEGRWVVGIQPGQLQALESESQDVVGYESLSKDVYSSRWSDCLSRLFFSPDYPCEGGQGLDVAFPVIHGSPGEDGLLQGLLELAQVPYVGCGVLGSALGMDKEKMKLVFRGAGLPTVDFLSYQRREWTRSPGMVMQAIERKLDYPCFVKPASQGSSIGVNKARDRESLKHAIDIAIEYDSKFIVERALNCREFSCSVLGNNEPIVSVVGESIFEGDFFSYEAKYFNASSHIVFPTDIAPFVYEKIRRLAIDAFRTLDLCGLARIDFFQDKKTEQIYINEVNTFPSFTPQCMYPKLCEVSGLSYERLLDRLIELALERYAERRPKRIASPLALCV